MCLFCLTCTGASATSATVTLQNGDTLSGTVSAENADTIVLESALLGELSIPRSSILELITANNDELDANDATRAMPNATTFTGRLDFGFEKDAGTSDTEELDFRVLASFEHGLALTSVELGYESESQRDTTVGEDFDITIEHERYSRAVRDGRFWYARAGWNRDRFRSVESWHTFGAGVGHAWRPTEATQLRIGTGLDAWAADAPGSLGSAIGARFFLGFNRELRNLNGLVVFSDAQLLHEVGGRGNQLLQTTSGFRMPLSEWIFAELSLEYDRFDAPDAPVTSANDETEWNFRIGARWR